MEKILNKIERRSPIDSVEHNRIENYICKKTQKHAAKKQQQLKKKNWKKIAKKTISNQNYAL